MPRSPKSPRSVSFHSDVDGISGNHKPSQYQTNLSIVEEGDNPESPTTEKDKFLSNNYNNNNSIHKHGTPHSSIEDVTTSSNGGGRSIKSRTHLTPDGIHHDNDSTGGASDQRRPSLILQYLRRPSVMATLRRSSIMSPFRSEPKDPNDPANRPEAIEQRLKNRRIGK